MDYQDLLLETGINKILETDIIAHKCSAKTGEGLYEGFDKLCKLI